MQKSGNPGPDRLIRLEEIAALEHVRRARLLERFEHELRGALGMLLPQLLDFRIDFAPFRHGRAPVAEYRRRLQQGSLLRRYGENLTDTLWQGICHGVLRSCDRQAKAAEIVILIVVAV